MTEQNKIEKIIDFLRVTRDDLLSYADAPECDDRGTVEASAAGESYDNALDFVVDLAYKDVLVDEFRYYVPVINADLVFHLAKKYDKKQLFEEAEDYYYQWSHPEYEDEELADEIENETPDDWIIDHMCNSMFDVDSVDVVHRD